jgi:regulator of extracellular matrix RemA (YlzA/DUF370 family)
MIRGFSCLALANPANSDPYITAGSKRKRQAIVVTDIFQVLSQVIIAAIQPRNAANNREQ